MATSVSDSTQKFDASMQLNDKAYGTGTAGLDFIVDSRLSVYIEGSYAAGGGGLKQSLMAAGCKINF